MLKENGKKMKMKNVKLFSVLEPLKWNIFEGWILKKSKL